MTEKERQELYSEYVGHINAMQDIAGKIDTYFFCMDNRGNFFSSCKEYEQMPGVLVLNMLRQNGFKQVVFDAVKMVDIIGKQDPELVMGIRENDEENIG